MPAQDYLTGPLLAVVCGAALRGAEPLAGLAAAVAAGASVSPASVRPAAAR